MLYGPGTGKYGEEAGPENVEYSSRGRDSEPRGRRMLYSETLYVGVDDLGNRDHIERDDDGI